MNTPSGVAVDPVAGRIYWANTNSDKISFANLNGSIGGEIDTTGATVKGPTGIAVDPVVGRVYWANEVGNKISFASVHGSGGGDLNTMGATVVGPRGVAVDPVAQRVYWANANGKISFANLDGSGGADVSTAAATVNDPGFPVLLNVPNGAGAPTLSGGRSPGSTLHCTQGTWGADLLPEFLYQAPDRFAYGWTRDGTLIGAATQSTITANAPGNYRCIVTAENHAGSTSQTSDVHTVATAPSKAPNTKILGATISSQKREATFRFTAIGRAVGFECALPSSHRKPTFTACRSPKTYKQLRAGEHTFEVRAIGAGGNDPSPAIERFGIG